MIAMEWEKSVLFKATQYALVILNNTICEFVKSCVSYRREVRAYIQGDFSAKKIRLKRERV